MRVSAAAALLLVPPTSVHAAKLGAYNIDPASLTVSGISAGGFFAAQFHIAYSSLVRGAGVVAGGPFYCAQGQLTNALTNCMSTGSINDGALQSYLSSQESQGAVDPLANLRDDSVVLWSGTQDNTVVQAVMKHLETQYKELSVPDVTTLFNFSAGHAWPTDFYGSGCGVTGSPWVNNCGYDYAGEIFGRWYGPGLAPRGEEVAGNLLAFEQAEFGASAGVSMGPTGYVYVPTTCAGGARCRLHVNFHGCKQYAGTLGTTYVSHTGLNRWAETNGVIVLYPQARESNVSPSNPNGCLDWWGYVDAAYATKSGTQIKIAKAMVDRVMSGSAPPAPPTPPPAPAPSPATCAGRAGGDTCLDAHTYIICPVGNVLACVTGTCHQVGPGSAYCS